MSIELTKNNFEEIVKQNEKPVLVDFWAPWCGPCRMLTPIIDELSGELGDDVIIAKINVDEQMELAQTYGVMSIPNVIIFNKGNAADNSVGVRKKQYYIDALKKLIST